MQNAGRHEETLQALQPALRASTNDARLLLCAASSLLALNRFDAALPMADQARKLASDLPEAHLVFAEAAAALGASGRAEAAYLTALELAPNSADAWFRRGAARRRVGNRAGAVADFEQALRLDPSHEKARACRNQLLTPPTYSAWRPTAASAALGLAVEYLCAKPAFASLPFGDWSQTLFWQTVRKHFLFVVEGERRICGFLGWALTEEALADAWVSGRQNLSNEECLDGDCVIVNAWAADDDAVQAFLREAAETLFAARRALYFKRHYADGRERAIRLNIPRHRRK